MGKRLAKEFQHPNRDAASWAMAQLDFMKRDGRRKERHAPLMPASSRGAFDAWLEANFSKHVLEISQNLPARTYMGVAYDSQECSGCYIPMFSTEEAVEVFLKDLGNVEPLTIISYFPGKRGKQLIPA